MGMYPAALPAQEGQSSHPEVESATSRCFQKERARARGMPFSISMLMTEASGSKPLATSARNSSAV
jgi:hypothetical protein